jgi:ABC-type branched-subunit amino acid transport system substrate-binding protein
MTAPVSPVADELASAVAAARDSKPAALCYLGLGVAARAVAVAIREQGWTVPVVANSALMFGYIRKDWRPDWEGWVYVDTIADENPVRAELKARAPRTAAGSVGIAAYDIGRLIAAALTRAGEPTRNGIRAALEQVKRLPATSGHVGTTMGFGRWDHGALKGPYLVLREWRDGRSVQRST